MYRRNVRWGEVLRLVALLFIFFGAGLSVPIAGADSTGHRSSGTGSITLAAKVPSGPAVASLAAPNALLMSENFESSWPSAGWRVFDDTGSAGGEFYWANKCTGASSARSAWAMGGGANGAAYSCGSYYPPYMESWAVYGPVDLSQATAASLTYSFWVNSECEGAGCAVKADRLWALASTDGASFDGDWWAGDWYNDPGATNGWNQRTLDLADWVGNPQVWVAFLFESDGSVNYAGGAFIDNVSLEADSCPATAFIRSLTTDRECFTPGSQIGVFADIGTSSGSQSVRLVAQLASFDVIWSSVERTITAPSQAVLSLPVPSDLDPDIYTVRLNVVDANSGCYQATQERTVRVDPVCGTVTSVVPATATPTVTPPAPPPCPQAGSVDVVFAMDTSGSMDDEFQTLCGQIAAIVGQLQAQGINVRYRILGIAETRDCATETVVGLLPGGLVNDSEDWAPAVADLSRRYAWDAGRTRLIVPISDEGPDNGDPVEDPGADRDAISDAIAAAQDSGVIVSPIIGSGFVYGVDVLAHDLARATGGQVFLSTDPSQDLAAAVARLIGSAACTPQVVSVSPECDVDANTVITITGANFLQGAYVSIGGRAARDVVVVSANQIRCRIDPALTPGAHDVTVSNPPGNWSHTKPHALTVGPCEGTCQPTRPEVSPVCTRPEYVRNGYFESGSRSWGQYSSTGRGLIVTEQVPQGFYAAKFLGPFGLAADEWLYQVVQVPPDATAASFWVEHVGYAGYRIDPAPPLTGQDFFRVSLYDSTLSQEIVRLWQFDPLSRCPIDPSAFNLTAAQLDMIRGRAVSLVFRFHKVTAQGHEAMVIIDGVHFAVCSPTPPCRIVGDKVAQPRVVRSRGEVAVALSLTGIEGACLTQRQPADVVLVVDRSGSMAGQKIWDARESAKQFVDRLQLSSDQIGVVSFADAATLDSGLTRTAGPVRNALDRLVANGNTDIDAAIRVAHGELLGPGHTFGNLPVLLLMSDGRPTAADPRPAADAAKAAGVRVITIGLGTDVDPDLLRSIASSPSDYFFAPDSAGLDAIYQQIAGMLGGSPATNITVIDRLSPFVTLIPGSFFGGLVPDVSVDQRTLTWRIPRLGFETRTLGYRVWMTDQAGTWPTNESAIATYTNSAGMPASLTFPVPSVVVMPTEQGHPDLVCRDHTHDTGSVPSNAQGQAWWDSPDIWVRNAEDGIQAHQHPVAGQANYVYVRVHNHGTATAHDVTVRVYDSAGAVSIRWPDDWVPELGSATIASIAPGQVAIVSIPWRPAAEGHYCFLARIESADDPVSFDGWVFDNNLCQRNMQILGGGTTTTGVGSGNRNRGSGYGSVTVRSRNVPVGSPPDAIGPNQAFGTVKIKFKDTGLFQRWLAAGGTVSGGQIISSESSVLLDVVDRGGLGNIDARIERLPFEDEETSGLDFEVSVAAGAEPPRLEVTQWVDGQAVGGNILQPEVLFPHSVYVPRVMKAFIAP